ncbi:MULTISPECIES: SDR family oxidoreductase [Paraburkholderia]|uniref:SDR family oxidoreductase n=1 Tax=Paraburkholderia TaxID=1822464 RepID=UPI00036851E8|nr:SDR family oxidoreductase [Paraburkholderia caledonica]
MIAVTGANGNLGQLVVKGLLEHLPATQIVAAVRDPAKAEGLRMLGVQIRKADYDDPETLVDAFAGVDQVLLISAVVPGERLRQHKSAIDAAKTAGVKLVAYTSMLRADTSSLILASEHSATEAYLKASGMNFILLRNGWYLENSTDAIAPALARGTIIGSASVGRFAAASRGDYAQAAAVVLTQPGHENRTYELAGDHAFTLPEFAEELSKVAGKTVTYSHLSAKEYEDILLAHGLPKMIVDVVVDAEVKSATGQLDSSSSDLATLLGRNTTHFSDAIRAALQV